MKRNQWIIITTTIIIIFIASLTVYFSSDSSKIINNTTNSTSSKVIGTSDYGNVVKSGPYGNKSSNIKIAYIVGVHPIESKAHHAVVEALIENESSLNYCYYIYQINVTKDADDYSKGRDNGQQLANNYVVPDAAAEHFQLAIDVHKNVGSWAQNTFIFSPVEGGKAQNIGIEISNKLQWLTYYVPPNPTSPKYLTTPLNNMGVPSIIYEVYTKDSNQTIKEYAIEFVSTVDGLKDL